MGLEKSITLDLPLPPSVNRIWRVGRSRNGKRVVYRDQKYVKWIKEAAAIIWLSRRPGSLIAPISGPFEVTITFTPPDKRWRDIDNLSKAVMDFLQHSQIITNDKNARKVTLEWGATRLGTSVTINY